MGDFKTKYEHLKAYMRSVEIENVKDEEAKFSRP